MRQINARKAASRLGCSLHTIHTLTRYGLLVDLKMRNKSHARHVASFDASQVRSLNRSDVRRILRGRVTENRANAIRQALCDPPPTRGPRTFQPDTDHPAARPLPTSTPPGVALRKGESLSTRFDRLEQLLGVVLDLLR